MTVKRISPLYLLPVFVFALAAFGAPHAALAATPTIDEVFTTDYGGYALGSLFGAPITPGVTQVVTGSYECSTSGGTIVTAGSSGYPPAFLSNPSYYCYDGRWFYYGHQAPVPVLGNWLTESGTGGYVCSGGSYFGCASIGGGLLVTMASRFSVQSCTAANACGVSSGGYRNVNGQCDATAPSLPSGYGSSCSVQSAPNSCSQRNTSYGTITCSGACSASTPAAPSNPSGYGSSCTVYSAANSCGMKNSASGTITCSGACSASTPAAPSNSLCAPTASCSVSPSSGYQGQTSFTYTASASGGNGSYTYSWSGTDGLTGSAASVSKTYSAPGSKTASVQVTSNGNSTTAICSPSSVTVNSCTPALSAAPSTVDLGQTTDLKWSVPAACASSCTFSDGHAVSGTSGTYTVTPPAPASGTTDAYAITCPSNSAFTNQTQVTVKVPTASISAAPPRLKQGGTSTITWAATNVDSCDITKNGGAWQTGLTADANRAVSGSAPDIISAQSTYLLSCVNNSGKVQAQASASTIVNLVPGFEEF